MSVLASEDAAAFEEWMRRPSTAVAPLHPITKGAGGERSECPKHCGVCENHLMTACCVLLDVTERCNQNCAWCFARAGEVAKRDPDIETVAAWYDRLLALGEERPFNIQLSGGEPTVRNDLPEIVRMGREKGFDYIQLNTNGKRLGEDSGYARTLKDAGLTTVFMQFDGMDDEIYKALRGEDLLDVKLKAIEACGRAGLPVTLVPTVVSGVNTDGTGRLIDFMLANLGVIKGIHFQPASFFGRHPDEKRVTMFEVMNSIEMQTEGRVKKSDLLPITTGHPLCCFCANFLREQDGAITSMTTDKQRDEGMSCCDEGRPCCGESGAGEEALDIVRRDRDFVLNKWAANAGQPDLKIRMDSNYSQRNTKSNDPMSLDEAIEWLRGNMFTLSGMAFMDRSNLDAERLKRCRVQVFTADGRLVPFCAYNSIYRDAIPSTE
jgi:uncharacterized radical SAM superfamily Fe-S cluster-containing enzyme